MIIAIEKFLQPHKNFGHEGNLTYARINLDTDHDLDTFIAHASAQTVPVLFKDAHLTHPSRWNEQTFSHVIEQHVACARALVARGHRRIVIGAHDDGFFHQLHSPRFGDLAQTERFQPLVNLVQTLQTLGADVCVIITVEELLPNGMDPTDGIALARALEQVGLKEIIGASGSKDFMPLFRRRATQKKSEANPDFVSHEPALASALWLKNHTNLVVSCLADIDDHEGAASLAQTLGLHSLIEKAQI